MAILTNPKGSCIDRGYKTVVSWCSVFQPQLFPKRRSRHTCFWHDTGLSACCFCWSIFVVWSSGRWNIASYVAPHCDFSYKKNKQTNKQNKTNPKPPTTPQKNKTKPKKKPQTIKQKKQNKKKKTQQQNKQPTNPCPSPSVIAFELKSHSRIRRLCPLWLLSWRSPRTWSVADVELF